MARKARTLRSEQKDATREQLLEAATKLLAEKGYAAFRVAAVAQEAGVSLGGMLHHFPTKDALVIAVLERLSARVLEQATQEVSSLSDGDDPLVCIANSAERFYSAPEFLMFLDIFLSVRRHTLIGDAAIRLLPSWRKTVEALWVPQLISKGVSEECAVLIIRTLRAVSRGLALSSGNDQDNAGRRATVDFIIQALRRTYLP